MKKAVWSGIVALAGLAALSTPAFAQQTANGTVNVSVTVNARAKLSINNATVAAISFADTDPDANGGVIAANQALDIDVKARTSPGGSVTLTVRADHDLQTAANDTIAISNLTWTSGSGGGFTANGTSSESAEVPVATFTGPGAHNGSQSYSLANSWNYAVGSYTATLTYTLTAP
jgi:hypothetical protein